jgi:hypothetical protein
MIRLLKIKAILIALSTLFITHDIMANVPPGYKNKVKDDSPPVLNTRTDCVAGASRFDMEINNVRAALLSSGDVWWDLNQGVYVVPKIPPGSTAKEVSSIYAGAVWLGGKDPSGNLKVAAQSYRTASRTDFWPGPLNDNTGQTNADNCDKWDKHFVVYRFEIDSMRNLYRKAKEANPQDPQVDCSLIPENLKGWPAAGNTHFFEIHRFTLPKRKKDFLAKFYDEDADGLYDPCKGDYPIVEVEGCESITAIPDQMVFWIYNDAGNTHTQSSRSTPIQMEVQVQAFAYQTNDELNDMTFQRYKLINYAKTDIEETYFAMWVDPDLGCHTDDYIGCDTSRNLMYVYNQDAVDGTNGDRCDGEVPTYGSKVPILGVDYFRGPKNEFGKELGMSSFTYYMNGGVCNPLPGMTDPSTAVEYYNLLTGKWKDGTPFSYGGNGYDPANTQPIRYAFVDSPNNPSGWSMCLPTPQPCGDRRTIQATGPLKLKTGAINELIVGVPWVADQAYPCPDIRRLQEADDIAQALFNNCFKIFDGPDAPDAHFVELDREIVVVLTNNPDSVLNNNAREQYKEKGLKIPATAKDSLYRFQGYKLYQLRDGTVGVAELENPEKSRLVAQVDIQDTISKIYNWTGTPDPNFGGRDIFIPELKVTGENAGIRHSFAIKEDKFASTDNKRLVNHKKYYFIAVAYAYNNYELFDEKREKGQRQPYVVGRRNIGDKNRGNKPYEVIPRPIVDAKLNSAYGDGPIITRFDGVGTGNSFLDMSEETLNKILGGTFDGTIIYKAGRGPINVKIYNPIEVVDGVYDLTFRDRNMGDDVLEKTATWTLKNTSSNVIVASENTIEKLNEQIIAKFGFSLSVGQVGEPGSSPIQDVENGAIGSEIVFSNKSQPWLTGVQDDQDFIAQFPYMFNFMKTGKNEVDSKLDPNESFKKKFDLFYPYYLCDYVYREPQSEQPTISPIWHSSQSTTFVTSVRTNNGLFNLNNVDIILTKDKSKWSRCVVVETAVPYYLESPRLRLTTEGGTSMFDLRRKPSVGKDAGPNGLPQPDGDGNGMSWFPGYAIDVETGKRVNIFFGENTAFDPNLGEYTPDSKGINRDMIWNPTSQAFLPVQFGFDPAYSAFLGGQHFIYVTNTEYDACKELRTIFSGSLFNRPRGARAITWTAMPFVRNNFKLLPFKDGLIPSDVTIKLRANNPFNVAKGKNTNNAHPSYQFEIKNRQSSPLTTAGIDSSLNMINVVPNPYLGFSAYEISEFSTTVKITNLPAKSTVTVYTLDGKFIRQFKRDEKPFLNAPSSNPGILAKQITPDLEWDLKNDKGIPIASGVYLIHVDSPQGQRTLKFFAVNRQFDASRL